MEVALAGCDVYEWCGLCRASPAPSIPQHTPDTFNEGVTFHSVVSAPGLELVKY